MAYFVPFLVGAAASGITYLISYISKKAMEERHQSEIAKIMAERDQEQQRNERAGQEIWHVERDVKEYFQELAQNPERKIIIALFGEIGVGKSSAINSLIQALSGRVVTIAPTASHEASEGHTMVRNKYEISPGVVVVDNRGMDSMSELDVLREMEAQIEGRRGYTKEVNFQVNKQAGDQRGERVHISVLVIRYGSQLPQQTRQQQKIKKMVRELKRLLGRPPYVIVTHHEKGNDTEVSGFRRALLSVGISEADIFYVENSCSQRRVLSHCSKEQFLRFLFQSVVEDGERAIEFQTRNGNGNEHDER